MIVRRWWLWKWPIAAQIEWLGLNLCWLEASHRMVCRKRGIDRYLWDTARLECCSASWDNRCTRREHCWRHIYRWKTSRTHARKHIGHYYVVVAWEGETARIVLFILLFVDHLSIVFDTVVDMFSPFGVLCAPWRWRVRQIDAAVLTVKFRHMCVFTSILLFFIILMYLSLFFFLV